MAIFPRWGLFPGGFTEMSLRALLYRRPTEPSALQIIFDKSVYLVQLRRHRQARRYTLRIDAPSREVVLTMPPRGSVREARDFAQQHGGWIAAACVARCGPNSTATASASCASPASRRISIGALATSSSARRGAISRPRAAAMRR